MSDASVINQSALQIPESFQIIAKVAVTPGTALTPLTGADAGTVGKALASAAQTARCCGLAAYNVGAGAHVASKYAGLLALTVAQWDAVLTDDTGTGLTVGAFYYVSAATAGGLTRTAPSGGNWDAPVGLALSAETLLILISAPTQSSS